MKRSQMPWARRTTITGDPWWPPRIPTEVVCPACTTSHLESVPSSTLLACPDDDCGEVRVLIPESPDTARVSAAPKGTA